MNIVWSNVQTTEFEPENGIVKVTDTINKFGKHKAILFDNTYYVFFLAAGSLKQTSQPEVYFSAIRVRVK